MPRDVAPTVRELRVENGIAVGYVTETLTVTVLPVYVSGDQLLEMVAELAGAINNSGDTMFEILAAVQGDALLPPCTMA